MSPKIQWPGAYPGGLWLDEREEESVLDVLRNGSLFRYYGINPPKHVDAYESAAREFYGVKHALGLGSGTGALNVAMSALGIGPGCEVIVPAFMWVSTIASVICANAIPVLAEVDDSLTMDPRDLERKITPRTKLIVPVHMSGAPSDMDAILRVASKHDIPVLEDCAQANGGSYKGKRLGSIGRMGIFSLQLNKNMTCGEGGLVITSDERLAARAFGAHDMGVNRVNGIAVPTEPQNMMWGQGRRMTEICGAIANVQLTKLPSIVNAMRGSKQRIKERLGNIKGMTFRRLNDPAGDSAAMMMMIFDDPARATAVSERCAAEGLPTSTLSNFGMHIYTGVPALAHKTPLSSAGNPWNLPENHQSVYNYAKGTCPQSDDLFVRTVALAIPSKLTPELESQAVQIVRDATQSATKPAMVGV